MERATDGEGPATGGRAAARGLLGLRAHYLLTFGALGALFPFLPLLLSDRGLEPGGIALVMVLGPVAGLLVPPLWGALADSFQGRVPLLRVASVGAGLAVLLLLPTLGLAGTLAAMACFAFFRAPLTALADATVYDVLGGANGGYGRVRLFGSIGFVVCVVGVGLAGGSERPALLLGGAATLHLLAAAATLALGRKPVRRHRGVLAGARAVVGRPALALALLATTVYYAGHATYDVYLGLHLRDVGLGDGFLGVAWGLGVAAEILVMLFARRLVRPGRTAALLAVAAAAATARWAVLGTTSSPAILLAVQPLHGLTFGLWYLALVEHVQARAPAPLRATVQAVALSAMGLGQVAGYLGGGWAYALVGGGPMFLGAAAAAALSGLLYAAAGYSERRETSRVRVEEGSSAGPG